MKKLVYSIAVILAIWLLAIGQDVKKNVQPIPLKTMNVPCLDSFHYFIGANFNTLIAKMIVSARVPNASPLLEAERVYYQFDTINNQWNFYSKENYSYFGTYSGAPYESIFQSPWSLALNSWDDTSYYIKYTGKTNYQINYPQQIITKQINSNYDYPNSQYTFKTKDIYNLLNDSCPSEHISYNYNISTQTYEPTNKRIFNYSSSNDLLDIIYQYYDVNTTQFVNSFKENYTYNGTLLQESFNQYWDGTSWVNNSKNIYLYDTNNKLTLYLSFTWNSTNWDSSYKQEYYYSPTADSTISYSWNSMTNAWYPSFKFATLYDSVGQTVAYVYYSWDGTAWYISSINNYTYDSQGNIIQYLTKVWDGSQLVNNFKADYYYTGNKNDSIIYYYWENASSSWIPNFKYLYTYGSSDELVIESSYYYSLGNWIEVEKYQYFYHLVDITGIPALLKDETFTLFPNPANDVLNISFSEQIPVTRMVIRDAQGKIIYDQNYSSRVINIKKLPSGLYYLSIVTDDQKVISKPFIKQ